MVAETVVWIGIAFCISQSAMFSGMNLAMFSISRLRLEVASTGGDANAQRVLHMRRDSNFLLTTILWGNVGINVLLTLLSDSVMAGVLAFLFSTVVITLIGEILPQAYFSRHALRMAALLAPVLRFYQWILFPVAKPAAIVLDRWLGPEGIHYFRESDLREVIKMHMQAEEAEVDHVEGAGALNFLAIDDLAVSREGEPIDPDSIISMPLSPSGLPEFPNFERSQDDPFLGQLERSGKKWVIITDAKNRPRFALDTDGFLRNALFGKGSLNAHHYCHRPIIVWETKVSLGDILKQMTVSPRKAGDDVIDQDLILVWADTRRVITGADVFGRLMRGISATTGSGVNTSAPPSPA